MGMVLDMKQRKSHAHLDDKSLWCKIEAAHRIIYDKNYAVNTQAVNAMLQEQSLTPTLVNSFYIVTDT